MANENGWGDGAANNDIGWGQGANNEIGWGASHALSWAGVTDIVGAPTTDPDAQAFITAASITDPTQQSAINQLVVDLKGYSIWSKFQAIYPMVGGVSTSHAVNLKNPGTFNLTFSGGWTHSATGAKPNGTNGYANTGYNPSVSALLNSHHLSYYSRTNSNGTEVEIGNSSTASLYNILEIRTSGTTYFIINNGTPFTTYSDANSQGYYIGNRTASNIINGWKNGTKVANGTNLSVSKPNNNIYIGAFNQNGSASTYSTKECAFASIGNGLTDTEAANLYTAVQTFQTTLGRSIGTQTVSDADAQAFVTAANIQDQVEATAVNNLVIGLKADSLWSKMKAIYPFVGGTSTTTSYNLTNPSLYQITWNGGLTFSSNGVLPNATNGYGNTGLTPSSALTLNNTHLSIYLRTSGGGGIDIGATAASDFQNLFVAQQYFGNFYADSYSSASRFMLATQTAGLLTISRTSSNSYKAFKNNTQIGTTITTTSGALPTWSMFIGASNRDNTAIVGYSSRQIAFASIGDGLSDTDVTNLNSRITTFQTALNRNV